MSNYIVPSWNHGLFNPEHFICFFDDTLQFGIITAADLPKIPLAWTLNKPFPPVRTMRCRFKQIVGVHIQGECDTLYYPPVP